MNKVFILFLLLSSLLLHAETKKYEGGIERYNQLITQALQIRERGEFLYKYIKPRLKMLPAEKVLTGEDMRLLHSYFSETYSLMVAANKFSAGLLTKDLALTEIEFTTAATSRKYEFSILNIFLGRNPNVLKYKVNPNDSRGHYFLSKIKMKLGIALVMYDNFLISLSPFYKNGALRRIINNDNIQLKSSLDKMVSDFLDTQKSKDTLYLYSLFNKSLEKRTNNRYTQDHEILNKIIIKSFAYQHFFKVRNLQRTMKSEVYFNRLSDFLLSTTSGTLEELSRVFGAIVGSMQITGKGAMLSLSYAEKSKIESQLRPLDILVERSDLHLTNLFIPGHFSHVAIWLGTEEELKELGVWQHIDEIEGKARRYLNYSGPSFKENIREGRLIVEALRPGVQMNTFEHFIDIDDFAVFRSKGLSADEKAFALERTLAQVGKNYDFNFDVETDRTIVCSELAYVVFEDFPWPVDRSLGRYTIEPDHVVELGLDDQYFDVVMFYKDGKKVSSPKEELSLLIKKQQKGLLQAEALFEESRESFP